MEKLTNFKIDPKRFNILKENVSNIYNFLLKHHRSFICPVHQELEEFFGGTTLPTRSVLPDSTFNRTLLE